MKKAIILRGAPGSGKSTLARKLQGLPQYEGLRIHSTDDYFCGADGVYRHNKDRLKEFHTKNYLAFIQSCNAGITAICDNTNVWKWQYERYITTARFLGYKVRIITMPHPAPEVAAARNIHGVPRETIEFLIREWESDPREELYHEGLTL
jgi:predicted kinase